MKSSIHSVNRSRRPKRPTSNNRRYQNNNPNRHWESVGPSVRIRGSAHQIYDKYIALALDAKRNGDRVLVENLMQHAEHYLRIMNHQQIHRQIRQQDHTLESESLQELDVDKEDIEHATSTMIDKKEHDQIDDEL